MPIKRISGFESLGYNSDTSAISLEDNEFSSCSNMRSSAKGVSPYGGHSDILDVPVNIEPHLLLTVSRGESELTLVPAKDGIYAVKGGSLVNLAGADFAEVASPNQWSASSLSGVAIVNSISNGPMYVLPDADTFQDLPFTSDSQGVKTWQELGHKADMIVTHKQFVFALGITDSNVYSPSTIRWSEPADSGAVPANWDPTTGSHTANIVELGGDGGPIVGALPLRNSLVIYRRNGITIADPAGNTYIWRFRHLAPSAGLLSKHAVVDVNGTHYFMTNRDIYITDGNSVKSIAHNRIKKALGTINSSYYKRCFAVHNSSDKEVMFCLPTGGAKSCNQAFIYNYENGSWFVRELPNIIYATYGSSKTAANTWDISKWQWRGYDKTWASGSTTPFDKSLLALIDNTHLGADGNPTQSKIIALDSILGFNNKSFNSIIERTDLILHDAETTTAVQSVYPFISGAQKVMIKIGSQQRPGGPITWKPAVEFDPKKHKKVDVRSTGMLHAYRIEAINVKTNFLLTGIDFKYVEDGF